MAPTIREMLAHPGNFTEGRAGCTVDHIAVHYTCGDGSARNNCVYFSNTPVSSSAHYFVDGSHEIWRSVRECDTAYAVGNMAANRRSISIEVVSTGGAFTEEEIEDLGWLVRDLMNRYGLSADRVIRHYDCYRVYNPRYGGSWIDPYKRCPLAYVDQDAWEDLHRQITGSEEHMPGRISLAMNKDVTNLAYTGARDAVKVVFHVAGSEGGSEWVEAKWQPVDSAWHWWGPGGWGERFRGKVYAGVQCTYNEASTSVDAK